MALVAAFFYLSLVLVLVCLTVALGLRILSWLRDEQLVGALEEVLYAAGISFAILGAATFVLGALGWLNKATAFLLLVVAGLSAGKGWRRLYELISLRPGKGKRVEYSGLGLVLGVSIACCAGLNSLLAMAPLTGSDALVYHFVVPKISLAEGPKPSFGLTNGFLTGQGHGLIELGMALGSDRISLGFILVGGLLAAGAVFVFVCHLTSARWAGLATLLFLLTPMAFWQMGTSGCPDIWMPFYTTLAVLAASRGVRSGEHRWLFVAGLLAGAVAGTKYTGWAIPVGVAGYCFLATGCLRRTVTFALWSLPVGVLPLLRNVWWSGDPFFPFLTTWLRPGNLNRYALAAIHGATHPPGFNLSIPGLMAFPLLLSLKGNAYGVGHYFGPLILALAPLIPWAFRRRGLAYAAALVWAVDLLLVNLTSQGARFLLPVFPLALALIIAGAAEVFRKDWRIIHAGCIGALSLALLFGFGSEILYARDFLPVVVGLEKRDAFLERMAPDYGLTSIVNRLLKGREGRTMVFFQHLYYLRVPFLVGDPQISWLMDPAVLKSPQALTALLCEQNVRWVVKAPDYPAPLARAFQALEDQGKLRPAFSADTSTYTGFRTYRERIPVHVIILELAPGCDSDHESSQCDASVLPVSATGRTCN